MTVVDERFLRLSGSLVRISVNLVHSVERALPSELARDLAMTRTCQDSSFGATSLRVH